ELGDLVRALGVHDDLAARMLVAERLDMLGAEALMHGAMTLPEQERRVLDVALLQPAEVVTGVPDAHVGLIEAHVVPGVAPEVLIREEEDLVAARECPLEDGASIRARAHGAAVLA